MSAAVWGAVAREFGLTVSLEHSGFPDPAVRLVGPWGGGHLTLGFTRGGAVGLVLATDEAQALMGDHDFRLAPRGQVPGVVGILTGDPTFDAAVAVYAADPRAVLPRLGAEARARVAALVAAGGWCTSGTVHLEPEALAAARDDAAARRLLGLALDALAVLAEPDSGQLTAQAFGDEPGPVKAASRAAIRDALDPDELLARLPATLSAEDRAVVLALRPESPATWALWLERLAPLAGAEVLAALVAAAQGRRVPAAAHAALGARLAAALRQGAASPGLLERAAELAARHGGCLQAICAALVADAEARPGGEAAAVAWLEGLPLDPTGALDTEQQQRVVDALLALDRPRGVARLLSLDAFHPGPATTLARRLATLVAEEAGGPLATDALARLVRVVLRWPEAPVCDAARRALADALPEALALQPPPDWAVQLGADLPPRLLTPLVDAALATPRPGTVAWLLSLPVPDPATAEALARWLGGLGDPRAEARLLGWLGHDVSGVRLAAIEALGKCGTLGAIARLEGFTGFFASGSLKGPAQAAIAAIRARGVLSPAGGLTAAEGEAGGLSDA